MGLPMWPQRANGLAAPVSSVTENIHQNQMDQLISCRPETAADMPGVFYQCFSSFMRKPNVFCCVLYWRFAGKQSWAAHHLTATIMKNGTFACVESVRMVVFHAPRARKIRLMLRLIQTSKRKHLYWQDFCIRGDLLPADVMLTSKYTFVRSRKNQNRSELPEKMSS